MDTKTLRSALLGSGAALALLAATVPASAGEIEDLRGQIQALQDKMSQIEAQQQANDRRRVAPAAAVEAGSAPRSWKLPGTNTSMAIGGYAKLDLIYDINAFGGPDTSFAGNLAAVFNFSRDGTAAGSRQGWFQLHARESRLFVKTWTPTDWGELITFIEGDFSGNVTADANEVSSNSAYLRLRQAYGQLGPVLAGQTWTTFMPLHSLPELLDFGGPAGTVFIRQGQIRYTHSFGGGTMLMLAVENPESVVLCGQKIPNACAGGTALGAGLDANNGLGFARTVAIDHMPDFVVALDHKWSSGEVSVRGLMRQISVDTGVATSVTSLPGNAHSVFAWGVNAAVSWNITKTDAIGAAINYGDGLGRYFPFTGRVDAILVSDLAGGAKLVALTSYGGYAWYQHKWTDTIRSSVVYGRWQRDLASDLGAPGKGGLAAGGLVHYVYMIQGNLIWSPVPPVDVGLEYSYGFADYYNAPPTGGSGKLSRIQMSFKYRF